MTHLAPIYPLLFEQGERLTLDEFLARWEQMPGLKFAELIDGVVYMASPLSFEYGRRDNHVQTLLGLYALRTAVCEAISNATWLLSGNAPQPDLVLALLPEFGGTRRLSGKLAAGIPELVLEICGSSRSFDLGPKMAMYQRAGVAEYVAVLLEEQRIEWRRLEAGSYRIQDRDAAGILKSSVFPGLWLNEQAIWSRDSAAMLDTLEAGLQSEECKAFLARVRRG